MYEYCITLYILRIVIKIMFSHFIDVIAFPLQLYLTPFKDI